VTVDDVVNRADVGRSTLYAHFGGLEGLLSHSLTMPSMALAMLVDQPANMDSLERQLEHFKEQKRRNRPFFEPPIRSRWVRRLAELIEPRLAASGLPLRLPATLAATQVAETQIALVANWLALSPTTPSSAIADALIAATRAMIDGLAAPAAQG